MNAEFIFKTASFVNDFGKDEIFIKKEINKSLTGHINRGSGISSSDNCGNCDGARCSNCKEVYDVVMYDTPFYNPETGSDEIKTLICKRFYDAKKAIDFYESL